MDDFTKEVFVAAMERTVRRLWILCIILIIALVGSNAAWIYYESQWSVVEDTQTIEATQDTDGGGSNMVIGGDYGTTNGEDNTNSQE